MNHAIRQIRVAFDPSSVKTDRTCKSGIDKREFALNQAIIQNHRFICAFWSSVPLPIKNPILRPTVEG
jgi:hypothetical protein